MENNIENKEPEGQKEEKGQGEQAEQQEPQEQLEQKRPDLDESEAVLTVPEADEEEAPEGDKQWDADLDVYPLREPAEDARWAARTVKIWVGFALCALAFILTLLILGTIYD